jgi:hypothetical protein
VKATSPIAPRRSSFDVVPSSWTVTPGLNIAQCWKSWAKRWFVTTCTASISSTSSTRSRSQSSIGRPPIGSRHFERSSVSGRSRVA